MSTHTERRSFNSEDAEEPHHDSQVMLSRCVALARPGSNGNTNAEMRGEKIESEFLAMRQVMAAPDETPPGRNNQTKLSHRGGRLRPEGLLRRWGIRPRLIMGMLLTGLSLGWLGGFIFTSQDAHSVPRPTKTGEAPIDVIVDRIIKVESNSDPNLKNKRSSAMGLGQFLNETWLDLIRTHRPDLAREHSEDEILELRRDANIAREITVRFTEQNAGMLRRRGLPVTPGTLYLAHFAGGGGAVAILSALENADAATVMAEADATGRTSREMLIKANPFLQRFSVADLKSWAHRKMGVPGS
jgi:hypothetical protein